MKRWHFLVLLLLAGVRPVAAHNYWIQPATFAPPPGKAVAVRVFVGDHLKSEAERPFQKKPTVRFQLLSRQGVVDLAARGKEGKTPMAEITCPKSGTYWIALERGPHTITLAADKFNRYLAEEGLRSILEQRRRAGEEKQPGRERYSRSLKCLLRAGGKSDITWKKILHHKLEIVPLADPSAVKPGGTLKVRILFEGKPLAGAALFALHKDGGKVRQQKLTTAADGTAGVVLRGKGMWLLRLVHMRRCRGCANADWESFWSALTFNYARERPGGQKLAAETGQFGFTGAPRHHGEQTHLNILEVEHAGELAMEETLFGQSRQHQVSRGRFLVEELLADLSEDGLAQGVAAAFARGDEFRVLAEVVEEVVPDLREVLGVDQFVLQRIEQR